jgi:6-phosphogluconolactonase (cycloisomerase 2 family)
MRLASWLSVLASVCVLDACGGGGGSCTPSPSPSHFLYAGSYKQDSTGGFVPSGIYAFGVDSTCGTLTAVSGSPFAPTAGGPVAISQDSKFLYAADEKGNLAGFSIASDGSLSPVSGSPFATPQPAGAFLANPTSDFLYEAGVSSLSVFAIDSATGATNLLSSMPLQDLLFPTATPDGRHLYVPLLHGTGALTPLPGSPSYGSSVSVGRLTAAGNFFDCRCQSPIGSRSGRDLLYRCVIHRSDEWSAAPVACRAGGTTLRVLRCGFFLPVCVRRS